MREGATHSSLVWITARQAVNPANIAWVFHGIHGEIEISFVGGHAMQTADPHLSPEGRALLLPPGHLTSVAAPAGG
jgi:hypothetical protein